MPTKNLRHGRIRIFSGDTPVRLEKTAAFTEGDFTFNRSKNIIQVKDRGKFRGGQGHLRKGDEEAMTFSFSAKFVDKTLRETLEDYVWEAVTFTVQGLTPQTNQTAAVPYRYRQGSLAAATGEAIATKLAVGATPSNDGEFAEPTGALRNEAEFVEVDPGTFQVQPGAGDTDMSVVFDAIGLSTLDPKGVAPPQCEGDKRTFLLILEKLDVALAESGVVSESWELNHATIETVEQAEGDEYDVLTFNGIAYITKSSFVSPLVTAPTSSVVEVVLADSIVIDDELPDSAVEVTS